MKHIALALGLLLAGSAQASEPILFPEFTPGTQNELASAGMLQGVVADRLTADGYILLTNDITGPIVGEQAVANCAAQPACPSQVLPKVPTRIAVVVRVNRDANGLVANLELYEQSRPTPVVARAVPLPPGQENILAQEISTAVAWLVTQIGPSPDAVIMAAARMIAGQDPSAAPPPAPVPVPAPVPAPVQPPPAPVPAPVPPPQPPPRPTTIVDLDGPGDPKATNGQVGSLGAETGVFPRHVMGSEEHWRKSEMDPRDWTYKYMPHAGRVFFEIRAGLAMGDVDRAADLRVEVDPNNTVGLEFWHEGPQTARRPRGGLVIGYAPATFIDIGMLVGLQYGQRFVSTGFQRLDRNDPNFVQTGESQAYPAVDAVQLYLQPRLRGYMVPVGPAKPFVFTGADIRVFNVYELQQPPQWQYPLPPGAVIPGWVGGGGLMLDPSPIVGFFFEGSYTQHFGSRAEAFINGTWTHETLPAPTGVGYTIATMGGIQFRI